MYSFTVVRRPPEPAFEAPYVLAIVDVTEGWSLLTWIVDCPVPDVHIGMEVEVRFTAGPDGALLPAFAPCAVERHAARVERERRQDRAVGQRRRSARRGNVMRGIG